MTLPAQDKSFFNSALEDTLNYWGNLILNGQEDFIKYNANEHFTEILLHAAEQENSIRYPFDSLKTAFHYTAPDKSFQFFNWTLPKKDGTFEYFCIFQSYHKKDKKYIIYRFKDKSDDIKAPENYISIPDKWYGALYYKVIYNKYKGKEYYTLLAWDGNNNYSRKKIIDVLTIDLQGKPSMGASVFKYENRICKRIIFEFKANANFTLTYDRQYVEKGKKKKWIIVYDRLLPETSNLKGFYQFYVPDKSIADAFYFKKGKWIQLKNIDFRSKKKPFIQLPSFYLKKNNENPLNQ